LFSLPLPKDTTSIDTYTEIGQQIANGNHCDYLAAILLKSTLSKNDLEHLRSYNAAPKENEWDTDEFFHARYDWFLDEIIWTFEQLQPDNFWEDQYWTEKPKLEFTDDKVTSINGQCDWDKVNEHQTRINNGLRLFGVYYNTLWD
jgi:hypothetical protein